MKSVSLVSSRKRAMVYEVGKRVLQRLTLQTVIVRGFIPDLLICSVVVCRVYVCWASDWIEGKRRASNGFFFTS